MGYEFGFITGALTMMLLAFINMHYYKAILLLKANNKESEKILGVWVDLEINNPLKSK